MVGAYKFSVALACRGVDSNGKGGSIPIVVRVGHHSPDTPNNPVKISRCRELTPAYPSIKLELL